MVENGGPKHFDGHRGVVAQAIADAADAGEDIINISGGIPHECGGLCAVSREAELAAEVDDVCIIAATGNQTEEEIGPLGVHCPALIDSVIGVGGFVSFCTAPLDRSDESGQWWAENDRFHGPFCGETGDCCIGETCEQNRTSAIWNGNVSFHNAAPDVLAPPVSVWGSALDELTVQVGTSFAAPLVSGILSRILGDLFDRHEHPELEEVHDAIRYTGTQLDEGGYPKLNADAIWNYLNS